MKSFLIIIKTMILTMISVVMIITRLMLMVVAVLLVAVYLCTFLFVRCVHTLSLSVTAGVQQYTLSINNQQQSHQTQDHKQQHARTHTHTHARTHARTHTHTKLKRTSSFFLNQKMHKPAMS